MIISDFKSLINEVRCGNAPNLGFTEDDLSQVKACIEKVQPIEVIDVEPDITLNTDDIDCLPNSILELQEMLEGQQSKLTDGVKQGILRAKIQELIDNLSIIKEYYDSRYYFLGDLIETVNNTSLSAANLKIENIEQFPMLDSATTIIIQQAFSKVSNQIIANFSNTASLTIPSSVATFDFRLINLNGVNLQLPNPITNILEDTVVAIYDSPFLEVNVFEPKLTFSTIHQDAFDPEQGSNPPPEESDYDFIPGLLYNGTSGSSYLGLYRKLAKPLTYLFTLEERGLTLDSNLIDPTIKNIKDYPSSINESGVTYYIANQSTYESFFDNLKEEYLKRTNDERNIVYPNAIENSIISINNLAIREAADVFRKSPGQGSSAILSFYLSSKTELDNLIQQSKATIEQLDSQIKENTMDEDYITSKIQEMPCFTKAANAVQETGPCEEEAKQKLGEDPLYLRTLGNVNFGLPDIGSQCYWKEFTKALNKVCLLPFPDLSGPPPTNLGFRYWPINCILPAGPALALLTIPPVWKPLFVIPTAIGTLICFLSMPLAPIGIPLPSVYVFYFAPDGTKYMILAVNLPLLLSNPSNLKFGFELDTSSESQNPLGLSPTNPYKGYPIKGAFNTSLKITAESSRATRLTKLAIDLASGKQPTVTNINGETLPFGVNSDDYEKYYLSETEMMKNIVDADPSKEFDREVEKLRGTLNRQLDKLGNMQTTEVDGIRQNVRDTRSGGVTEAEKEKDLAKKRKKKKIARALDPTTLEEKINSTLGAFNEHIENIKFGTIRFPKDATKNNPGLPEALTAIMDLVTMGSLGDLRIEDSASNLNTQIKKAVAKINMNEVTSEESFDLEDPQGLPKLKEALNNMVIKTLAYLKGEPVTFDTSAGATEEEKMQIEESNKKVQELTRDALAFTAVALLNPPKITLFDFSKKCCEVSSQPVFPGAPPELATAFGVLAALMQAVIDGVTTEDILNFIGTSTKQVKATFLNTLFDSLVTMVPNVPLPTPANLLTLIQAFLVPVLSLISIPKAPNPLQPPMLSIVIPLDLILKPILKLLIAGLISSIFKLMDQAANAYGDKETLVVPIANQQGIFAGSLLDRERINQVFTEDCGFNTTVSVTIDDSGTVTGQQSTKDSPVFRISLNMPDGSTIVLPVLPFIALDLVAHFYMITGADIVEFVRTLMNAVFDMIMAPLQAVMSLISSLALSLNSYSYNIIEAALPLISILKLAKIALDATIPNSTKLQIISPELFNIIQLSIIPALELAEPVLKEIAWLGALSLCAVSSPVTNYLPVSAARLSHPIMNMDDLPPWERLTHKNPLFAIFLDEIAWRGSIYSTGSLIFQTKTPAVLPYTPTFPILHISPHLL